MNPHQFASSFLIPLFILNMGAIVVTLFIKKRLPPYLSRSLDRAFIVENIVGILCAAALAYISLFVKG